MHTLSKKAQAIALYSKIAGTNKDSRPEVVQMLMEKVGLTEQGAQTYYSNMKNGIWQLTSAPHSTRHVRTEGRLSRFARRAASLFRNNKIDQLDVDEINELLTKVSGQEAHYSRRGVAVNRLKESLRNQGALESTS